jgi:hypothetical protein
MKIRIQALPHMHNTCIRIYIRSYIHANKHTHACNGRFVYCCTAYVHAYTWYKLRRNMHMYIHIYIHTHIHVYTYIYIPTYNQICAVQHTHTRMYAYVRFLLLEPQGVVGHNRFAPEIGVPWETHRSIQRRIRLYSRQQTR